MNGKRNKLMSRRKCKVSVPDYTYFFAFTNSHLRTVHHKLSESQSSHLAQ
jgi:hypothetical protein